MASTRLACALVALSLLACGARTPPGDLLAAGDAAGPDAPVGPDGSPSGCDAGPLPDVVYALDSAGILVRYDPVTHRVQTLGTPACGNTSVPWTMTASRDTVFIVYTDWTLYTVSLATMQCASTPFQAGQLGLDVEFGVAATGSGPSERLFYYGLPTGGSTPILAVSDTTSFVLTKVGDIHPTPPPSSFPLNLTADATGHLYGFSPLGLVQEIDSASGAVLQSVDTGVTSMSTWATIIDGPDLFLWVDSRVVGYDLSAHQQTSEYDAGVYAIGAGSFSACPGG